jgi:hypothetical protein
MHVFFWELCTMWKIVTIIFCYFSIVGNPLVCATGNEPNCHGMTLMPISMNLNNTQGKIFEIKIMINHLCNTDTSNWKCVVSNTNTTLTRIVTFNHFYFFFKFLMVSTFLCSIVSSVWCRFRCLYQYIIFN